MPEQYLDIPTYMSVMLCSLVNRERLSDSCVNIGAEMFTTPQLFGNAYSLQLPLL